MKGSKVLGLFALVGLFVLSACGIQSGSETVPLLVGSQAPDFNLENALGGQTALSEYQGQPVFLFFHMAVG